MFDIGWGEFVVIAVVALIVIGPKELPAVLRGIGQWTTKIRRMAAEFQGQFQEALREAEMADLKKEVDTLNDAARGVASQFDDPLNFKEATKWEPKPDTTTPDTAKPDQAKGSDSPPDSAPVTPDSPPHAPHAGEGREGEEAFPIAAQQPVVEQSAASPVAVDTASSPPATQPAVQPPLPEECAQRGGEGAVHP
jgi:sec-independent protein translocase protein TatB